MNAVIVGGGPAGCLLAIGLRRRGLDVSVHERSDDPRVTPAEQGRSFNLTLSHRGAAALEATLATTFNLAARRLWQRVIHPSHTAVIRQPYGYAADHFLLSMPRHVLHACLLSEAERAGARISFSSICVAVDPFSATATFQRGGQIETAHADLLIGADGAGSVVRREMANAGGLAIRQERSAQGYVELRIEDGTALDAVAAEDRQPRPVTDGLHLWPRGTFVLAAQPNVDATYTATLFLPLADNVRNGWSFEHLADRSTAQRFVEKYFPDLAGSTRDLASQLIAHRPAALKVVRCSQFHFRNCVLLGDAAHTMVPFYGQGINCALEDVAVLMKILDEAESPGIDIASCLTQFTVRRKAPTDAIVDLSTQHWQELCNTVSEPSYHAKARVERALAARYPQSFSTLYAGVAFSTTPYDVVVRRYEHQRRRLAALFERFDPARDVELIVKAYAEAESMQSGIGAEH
jgi:2-polyprenyl-6-methoxyphenol hydroxylase-like FAD-dependent oxidoreductase